MRVLVALGGNALPRRGELAESSAQLADATAAAEALAGVAADHELILTHGNGPQSGPPELQSDGYGAAAPHPLELALRNALPGRDLVTVLAAVVVDAEDGARAPSKPIGPVYAAVEARRLVAERGWSIGPDGDGFRRLLPSPEPRAIVALRSLRTLLDAGALVIRAGGGGVAVALDGDGTMQGVEAVVDEDLTAALLARRLDADLLVMLTDVDAVYLDWGGGG
mgnify:CR=1 FL=1